MWSYPSGELLVTTGRCMIEGGREGGGEGGGSEEEKGRGRWWREGEVS